MEKAAKFFIRRIRGLNVRCMPLHTVVLALYDDVSYMYCLRIVYKQQISYFIFTYEIMNY